MAFNISGSWNLALIPRNNPSLNYGVALIPRLHPDDSKSSSIAGGELLIVMKDSPVAGEALRLAKFLTRLENVMPIVEKQRNVIPAVRSGINHEYYRGQSKQRLFYQQLLESRPMPVHPAWIEIQEQFSKAIEKILIKDHDPDATLTTASKNINRILGRYPGDSKQ